MRQVSLGLALALLLLATTGCEIMTTSGLRKLGSYELESFPAALDPAVFRFAVEHDARVRVDPSRTFLEILVGPAGKERLLHRFEPTILASGSSGVSGLPKAGQGRTWSLLELSASDLQLAREVQQLLRSLARIQGAGAKDGVAVETFEKALKSWFPDLEFVTKETDYNFWVLFDIDFTSSPAVSRKRFPLSVWLLLDHEDGFFQIVNSKINLDHKAED
jgi:hypothetical protein